MRQFGIFIVIVVLFALIATAFNIIPRSVDGAPDNGGSTNGATTTPVTLYYYNPAKDVDTEGNILCSREGLVGVDREVPKDETLALIENTIRLLLQGELSASERAQGITTEYPLEGLALEQATTTNGTLSLTFSDPNARTSGGACRAGVLWLQIEKTAKQFKGVDGVRFEPEELFQP